VFVHVFTPEAVQMANLWHQTSLLQCCSEAACTRGAGQWLWHGALRFRDSVVKDELGLFRFVCCEGGVTGVDNCA